MFGNSITVILAICTDDKSTCMKDMMYEFYTVNYIQYLKDDIYHNQLHDKDPITGFIFLEGVVYFARLPLDVDPVLLSKSVVARLEILSTGQNGNQSSFKFAVILCRS